MNYRTRLTSHLTDYKKNKLGVTEPGFFRYRHEDVECGHILPSDQKWKNLLEDATPIIRSYLERNPRIKLHRYFHHLSSSQAFALNLFVPFFESGADASNALIRGFGQQGTLSKWKAEAVPDSREGTNLDAWWSLDDGFQTFCEVKLCEGEFGKCDADDAHKEKLKAIYRPRLIHYVHDDLLKEKPFFQSYQLLRNIWHLVGTEQSELIFLMPKENVALWKHLDSVLRLIDPALRARVKAVAIETLLRRLIEDPLCPPVFVEYAKSLQSKYVPLP
jgi:hypothetical protein